jgi:hypothetical protein
MTAGSGTMFAHHLIHGRFHEARRDRLPMAIPLAIVRNQMRIVANIHAKLINGFLQLLKRGIRLLEVVNQGRNVVDFV